LKRDVDAPSIDLHGSAARTARPEKQSGVELKRGIAVDHFFIREG
jgi:hypothetical protein